MIKQSTAIISKKYIVFISLNYLINIDLIIKIFFEKLKILANFNIKRNAKINNIRND